MSGENKRVFVGPFKERRPGQGSWAHRGPVRSQCGAAGLPPSCLCGGASTGTSGTFSLPRHRAGQSRVIPTGCPQARPYQNQ